MRSISSKHLQRGDGIKSWCALFLKGCLNWYAGAVFKSFHILGPTLTKYFVLKKTPLFSSLQQNENPQMVASKSIFHINFFIQHVKLTRCCSSLYLSEENMLQFYCLSSIPFYLYRNQLNDDDLRSIDPRLWGGHTHIDLLTLPNHHLKFPWWKHFSLDHMNWQDTNIYAFICLYLELFCIPILGAYSSKAANVMN